MSEPQIRVRNFNKALAAFLHDRRLSAELSQSALANELGLDQAAVSRGESGERRISIGEALAWFEALGLTAGEAGQIISDLWAEYGSRSETLWSSYGQ